MAAAGAHDPTHGMEPADQERYIEKCAIESIPQITLCVMAQIVSEQHDVAMTAVQQDKTFVTRAEEITDTIQRVRSIINYLDRVDKTYINQVYEDICVQTTAWLSRADVTALSSTRPWESKYLIPQHEHMLRIFNDLQQNLLEDIKHTMINEGQYTTFARGLWSTLEQQTPRVCVGLRNITYAMLQRQMHGGNVLPEDPFETYLFAIKVRYLMEMLIRCGPVQNDW